MYGMQKALVEGMLELLPEQGIYPTLSEDIALVRSDLPTERTAILYEPVFYIVIQGKKVSYLGEEAYHYDPLNFLALSVPLPMEGQVIEASEDSPYLAIKIKVSLPMLRDLISELPDFQIPTETGRGVRVCPMSGELTGVVVRLLESLSDDKKAVVLVPMIIKEALFHVLLGPQGAQLSAFATHGRHHQRVAKVIRFIQSHFNEPLDVESLARLANMSSSSLHQHFKAVTNSSPLQYVKAVRLHHAHNLVTLEDMTVSEAAYTVGYQSLSQFSREYKRMFGKIPSHSRLAG